MASLLTGICARARNLFFGFVAQISKQITCTHLRSLSIVKCTLRHVDNLLVFPNLTEIYLDECSGITTETLLKRLAECTKLEQFTIDNCALIDNRVISYLLNHCQRLESLDVRAASLQPFNLNHILAECDNQTNLSLRTLKLTECRVCSGSLQKLAAYAPLLSVFQLNGFWSDIYNADVAFLGQHCSHLTDITFNNCARLDNAAVYAIVRYLPRLQKLCLSSCVAVGDEGVLALAKGCLQLTSLNIAYCNSLTDAAMHQVWQNCVLLVDLDVSGCSRLTDATFAGHCSTVLRALMVSATSVTGSFLGQMPKLHRLCCNDCPCIDSDIVQRCTPFQNCIKVLFLNNTCLSIADLLLLSQHLPLIEKLAFANSAANDDVVTSFAKNCPKLTWMYAKGCTAVSRARVGELAQRHKLYIST